MWGRFIKLEVIPNELKVTITQIEIIIRKIARLKQNIELGIAEYHKEALRIKKYYKEALRR